MEVSGQLHASAALPSEGEWRYSSTHSLTSGLDGGEWSASHPGRFTPEKEPLVPISNYPKDNDEIQKVCESESPGSNPVLCNMSILYHGEPARPSLQTQCAYSECLLGVMYNV